MYSLLTGAHFIEQKAERSHRGLVRRFAKPLYGVKTVSRVRIPPSPNEHPRMRRGASELLRLREGFEKRSHIFVLRSKGKNGELGPREISVRKFTCGRIPPSSKI